MGEDRKQGLKVLQFKGPKERQDQWFRDQLERLAGDESVDLSGAVLIVPSTWDFIHASDNPYEAVCTAQHSAHSILNQVCRDRG